MLVRGDPRPFALVGAWAGGGALLGSEPLRSAGADEDPFALLDDMPAVAGEGVGGGWFGWLGYGLGRRVERIPPAPPRPRAARLPLAFYDHVLRLDAEGRWWFEALWTADRADALTARRGRACARAYRSRRAVPTPARCHRRPSPAGHAEAVAAAREYIRAGDLYQANLTPTAGAPFAGDALDLFADGVARAAPRYGAFVGGDGAAVASPVARALPRAPRPDRAHGPDQGHGTALRLPSRGRALEGSSPREGPAENVMILDLMRNDLGRVCEYGSVRVTRRAEAEAHAGVWHLVSRCRDGCAATSRRGVVGGRPSRPAG